ncbi:TetR/AcrR family transcriptional regulator [Dictyobacter kobayashii]|uniref:TetR family transcriptional regulator n=1 Tax=Dictyobacter kobayashii TaxID=2014872 RepID=A0A402AYQ4_9CHLR|nr:TetR/AcrR family transcriptional regulator [Dictyobacter kobayashii]GCE24236.1 TetR family transcriptional regulator [Dictyobacter kobayashii]
MMARTPKVVEDRREHILEVALTVFSEKGFSRTTNNDIARAAGITPGLIYHYFENKDELLGAIVETRSPLGLMRSLPPERLDMPPELFLKFLLVQVLGIVEGETCVKLLRILLPEALHNAAVIEPIRSQLLGQVVSFLRSYYTHQIELGNICQTDPTFLAHLTFSCLVGFVTRRQIVGDPTVAQYSHEQLATLITETIVNGIKPH